MEGDYIRVQRTIVNSWLWQQAEWLKWWLDLLLMATAENRKIVQVGQEIELEAGQIAVTISALEKRWGRSRWTITRFLAKCNERNILRYNTCYIGCYNRITIITICNYESYVGCEKGACYIGCNNPCNKGCNIDGQHLNNNYLNEKINNNNNIYNNKNNINLTSLHSVRFADKSARNHSPIDFVSLLNFFNIKVEENYSTISKIKTITDKRKKILLARYREHGKESIARVIENAVVSDFLNGKNDKGWVADFDWLMRPSNFVKVLEGNYNKPYGKDDKRRTTEVEAATAEDYGTTF